MGILRHAASFIAITYKAHISVLILSAKLLNIDEQPKDLGIHF